jgi:hypothetical protein
MGVDYKDVVSCRIAESIFCMILHDLVDMVTPGWLYPMKKIYGVHWKANVITAWCVIKATASMLVLVLLLTFSMCTWYGACLGESKSNTS